MSTAAQQQAHLSITFLSFSPLPSPTTPPRRRVSSPYWFVRVRSKGQGFRPPISLTCPKILIRSSDPHQSSASCMSCLLFFFLSFFLSLGGVGWGGGRGGVFLGFWGGLSCDFATPAHGVKASGQKVLECDRDAFPGGESLQKVGTFVSL